MNAEDPNPTSSSSAKPARQRRVSLRSNVIFLMILMLFSVLFFNIYLLHRNENQGHGVQFSQILEQSMRTSNHSHYGGAKTKDLAVVDKIKKQVKDMNTPLNQTEELVSDLDSMNDKAKDVLKNRTSEDSQQKNTNLTGYNVLLLYADDWSHHTLSSYHKTKPVNSILKTPHLTNSHLKG
jgi:cell shape-determining protein MreC